MATTQFNLNILSAARKLKDARTTADASSDTGKRYSSALLSDYQNRAVRDLLTETYAKLGADFGSAIPEYMKTSGALSLVSGSVAKPSDAWYTTDLSLNLGSSGTTLKRKLSGTLWYGGGDANLGGVGTKFLTELVVGQTVTVGGVSKIIASILTDTQATVTVDFGAETQDTLLYATLSGTAWTIASTGLSTMAITGGKALTELAVGATILADTFPRTVASIISNTQITLVSELSAWFSKLPAGKVDAVRTGRERLIVPTAERPVFYEEGSNIKTLGILDGSVLARYVKTHQDITVSVAAAGNGRIYATAAQITWTAATRTLKILADATGYVQADLGKLIVFRTSAIVYSGKLETLTIDLTASPDKVEMILASGNLPAGNIVPSSVIEVLCIDSLPDSVDLNINPNFYGNIVDRMVAFGLQDAKNGVV